MSWDSGSDDDEWDAGDAAPAKPFGFSGVGAAAAGAGGGKAWDDEVDEVETAPAPAGPPTAEIDPSKPLRPKQKAKLARKKREERRQREMEEARLQLAAQKELDDPVAEKLRRQKLVEEADHRITEELFAAGEEGEATGAGGGAGAAAAVALDNEGHVAGLQLEDAADFVALGQLLGKRLVEVDNTPYVMMFLEELVQNVHPCMASNDIKVISKSLSVLQRAKQKEEAAAKKKGNKKKKKGAVPKMQSQDEWMAGGGYEDGVVGDEYDMFS